MQQHGIRSAHGIAPANGQAVFLSFVHVMEALRKTVRSCVIILEQGDITRQGTDAIVNAANSTLLGGGGVDGAIHRAGGPRILEACRAITSRQGGCPPGEAVITEGGMLQARHVIHTVGPVWRGGANGEDGVLQRAYQNSLRLAMDHALQSIAFPSISTGAYGFPIELAARIAVTTISRFLEENARPHEVRIIVYSGHDFDVYRRHFSP
jgi:O-acetyl-ADP-ribose deacetylase (regulator of RNase III)